jgi:hypothetical protein
MRIWKFGIQAVDRQSVQMPAGAKPLTVELQRSTLQIWALVDQTAPRSSRIVACYMTGQEVPDDPGQYIGTVHQTGSDGQPFVLHFFLE